MSGGSTGFVTKGPGFKWGPWTSHLTFEFLFAGLKNGVITIMTVLMAKKGGNLTCKLLKHLRNCY